MKIPRDALFESTLPLIFDPYRFISRRCAKNDSDIFFTRLMLRPTVCMVGEEATRLFYDETFIMRAGAAPGWLQKTLLGRRGIQTLDDAEHKERKKIFLELTSYQKVIELTEIVSSLLKEYSRLWIFAPRVVLYREFQEILTSAVCRWAGVPLTDGELKARTEQLTALFDNAGRIGIGHIKARISRRRAEKWIAGCVQEVRRGLLAPDVSSPLHVVSNWRSRDGHLLDIHTAAVELLNILRPTVAVSVYAVFCALALHSYPEYRDRIINDPSFIEPFVQEVRRFYPFSPSVLGKTRKEFVWMGYDFKKEWTVTLDLYGTNHDSRIWRAPHQFRPERFLNLEMPPYSFIPQGGGDKHLTHRCPGEPITVEIMKLIVSHLVFRIDYEVGRQSLSVDMRRLPALPKSELIISNVRQKPEALPVDFRPSNIAEKACPYAAG